MVREELCFFLEDMDRGRRLRKEEADILPKKPVSIDSAAFDFIVSDSEQIEASKESEIDQILRERERERERRGGKRNRVQILKWKRRTLMKKKANDYELTVIN